MKYPIENAKKTTNAYLYGLKHPIMLRVYSILIFFLLGIQLLVAQSVQDIINQVSQPNLELVVAELSGEQATVINGTTQTIASRVQSNNDLTAEYLEERLSALPSLNVEVQNFNTSGKNVIATQLGQTNPDEIYLVCAHYDSVTTFCADDNATGVAAVLEIARILSTQCIDKTIVYALWDEEEIGLRGANFYAQEAADTSNGNTRDNIIAVLNMDMIGYDGDSPGTPGDNDFDIDVRDIANSLTIKDDLLNLLNMYTFDLNPIVVDPGTSASDHSRFWQQNYSAVLVGESWETNDQTPDYHTSNDRIDDIDFPYMTEITKLVGAYLATKVQLVDLDNTVTVNGTSLSSNDLGATYQWINCDTYMPISGANQRTFTPSSNGNYAVEVSNGICTERSTCFNFNILSTESFDADVINVYPNPTKTLLFIDNPFNLKLSAEVIDISGKQILKQQSTNRTITLDIKNQPKGIYFVKVNSSSKASSFKIVKE